MNWQSKGPQGTGLFQAKAGLGNGCFWMPSPAPLSQKTRYSCPISVKWNWFYLVPLSAVVKINGFKQNRSFQSISPSLNQEVMSGEFQMLTLPYCYHFSLRLPLLWQPRVWMATWNGSLLSLSLPLLISLSVSLFISPFDENRFLSGWDTLHIFKSNRIFLPRYCTSSKHNKKVNCLEIWKALFQWSSKARHI